MSELDPNRLKKILGAYLAICATYQLALHFWPGGEFPMISPRFGVKYLENTVFQIPALLSTLLDLFLVGWLFVVSISCFAKASLLKAYVTFEVLLSLPTVFWIISLLALGGGHIFGKVFALVPLSILILFSGIPLLLAIRILRQVEPSQTSG